MEHNNDFEVLSWPPNSRFQSNQACVGCADGQASPIHGGLTSQFTTLKGAVANIWVRIPQPTFRGLVESMTQKRQIGVRKTIQLYISKATK